MKTFAITLERAKERRDYIQKHLSELGLDFELELGVDGRMLAKKDLEKFADLEAVRKAPEWLNNGAVGCALSHYNIYKKIVDEDLDCAFIVEDDIILPKNIQEILEVVSHKIKENEAILFYFVSFKECLFSKQNSIQLAKDGLGLYYPLDPNQPITTGAYVIHNLAAKKMVESLLPIRVTADSWGYFIKNGMIGSIRCLYPLVTQIKNFKSSIDYIDPNSIKGRFLDWINENRVIGFYHFTGWLRKINQRKLTGRFRLVDKEVDWLKKD